MAEGNVVCDCPDGHIKLGPYSDSVPQTPVSAKEPPKRKKAVRKKKEIDKKVPKLKLDLSKFKEIPPVTDDNGEYTEVQVLEAFNPDEILANIFNTPQSNTPHCPRCVVPMSYGCIKATDGSDWYKYYRCPTTWWTTKCYVTCGVDNTIRFLCWGTIRTVSCDTGNVILVNPTFHPSSLNNNTLGKRFLNLLEALS